LISKIPGLSLLSALFSTLFFPALAPAAAPAVFPPAIPPAISVAHVNRNKMEQWIGEFPGVLNDTGDLPVYRRGNGHFG